MWNYLSKANITCEVECKTKQQKSSEEVAEESDHSAGDALGHRVNRLDEQLQENGHAAVDEDTHQDTRGVESGYRRKYETWMSNTYPERYNPKPHCWIYPFKYDAWHKTTILKSSCYRKKCSIWKDLLKFYLNCNANPITLVC